VPDGAVTISKGTPMTPEQRDELMAFILQSQSTAAEEHRNAMARMDQFDLELRALLAVSHDLVEGARRHDRRLDDLEGLNP
jgi:hypothetical protein